MPPDFQMTTLQLGYGATRKMGYDTRGYLTTMIDSGSSGAISTIIDTYDAAGRKTNQLRDGVMTTYTMDSDDRLTLSNRTGQLSTFAYDDDRNLTLLHNHGQNAVTMSHNSFGQVVTSIAGAVVTTNTWDNAGRKTVANVGGTLTTFGWDQESRMVSRVRLTTTDLFVYDEANHLRYRHDPNSEGLDTLSYNYLDDNTFTVYSGQFGTRSEQLTPLEGVNVGNDDLDFLLDPLGSVIGKTSSSGVEDLAVFFPYGEPFIGARPVSDLWAFVGSLGYRRFDDTLYDVWNRWLETDAGHWKSADALWPDELAYMYVEGMPQMALDPTGLTPACLIPCGCAVPCIADLLLACADWSGFESYADCLKKTYAELPGWLTFICEGCIAGCIMCLTKSPCARPQPPKTAPRGAPPVKRHSPPPSKGARLPRRGSPRPSNPNFPKGRQYRNCKNLQSRMP